MIVLLCCCGIMVSWLTGYQLRVKFHVLALSHTQTFYTFSRITNSSPLCVICIILKNKIATDCNDAYIITDFITILSLNKKIYRNRSKERYKKIEFFRSADLWNSLSKHRMLQCRRANADVRDTWCLHTDRGQVVTRITNQGLKQSFGVFTRVFTMASPLLNQNFY